MSKPSFTVGLDIKDMFFDRQRVLDTVRAENRKKLSNAGAFIRRRARSKLGRPVSRRVRPAAPGRPPRVRSRNARANLKYILFGLNTDWESVVIGPVGLPDKKLRGSSAQTVPELMEYGGTARAGGERQRYAKHPFMGPTLEEEVKAGKIGDFWR